MVAARKTRRLPRDVQKEVARRRSKIIERTPATNPRNSRLGKAQRLVYAVLAAIVVVIAIFILFFSGTFRAQKVVVVGTENISDDRIEEIIHETGEGKYWGFIPRDNVLVFNTKLAETELKDEIAQIRSVTIKRQMPDILKVYVEERDPVIIWETDGKKYYLDVDGVVSKDISGNPELELPVIKDLSNKQAVAREQLVSENFVSFMTELVNTFNEETGLEIAEILTPSPLSREIHVKTSEGWLIYFTSARTLSSQYEKLLLIINKEIPEGERGNLEYIDLRIQDKIYYK